jgi:hypothetical protein
MRVGVERPAVEHRAEEHAEQPVGEHGPRNAAPVDGGGVGDRAAPHALEHEDGVGRHTAPHLGHGDALDVGVGDRGMQRAAVGGLLDIVEFLADGADQLLGHPHQPERAGGLRASLRDPACPAQDGGVARNPDFDVRSADLDDHVFAVERLRDVRLADGGRREWFLGERGEGLLRGTTQLALEDHMHLRHRHGLDVGLEVLEGGNEGRRQEVRAGGSDLSELHEHAAAVFEEAGDPPGCLGRREG